MVASIVKRRVFSYLACGRGVRRINHKARINHGNVAEAADVPVAAPSPRLVAPRSPRGDHANSAYIRPARRLVIEATVNL
jgi:hypothetical protein